MILPKIVEDPTRHLTTMAEGNITVQLGQHPPRPPSAPFTIPYINPYPKNTQLAYDYQTTKLTKNYPTTSKKPLVYPTLKLQKF